MEQREFIEVGATVRVENGPALKTGTATEELLEDLHGWYSVGAFDARGKPVVAGEAMHYLDWAGPWVWYLSELRGLRWEPAGEEQTKEAALEAAGRLARGE